ncbi:MAG: O-antigen ligase family protein [Ideonella sp.]|nr:O-antigen ligase family protein [Ideonella sp.]
MKRVGAVVGFVLAWSISLLVGRRVDLHWTIIDTCFALFMAWFAATVLLHVLIASTPGVTNSHIASWVQLLACYLAVRHVSLELVRTPLMWTTAVFSAAVLWAAQTDLLGLLLRGSDESSAATYQGLARAVLISAAFGLNGQRSRLVRWLGYVITLFVLFLVGARSEIVGAAILFGVLEVAASRRPMLIVMVVAASTGLAAILVFGALDTLSELFPDSRFLALLLEGSGDASAVERAIYQELAWRAVLDSPILGDYGHYERAASAGAYAHNWLSAWVDLGLIGLLLFAALHLVAAWSAALVYRSAATSGDTARKRQAALGIGLLAMVTVFNLVAKSFADPGLATATALLAALVAAYPCRRKMPVPKSVRKSIGKSHLPVQLA